MEATGGGADMVQAFWIVCIVLFGFAGIAAIVVLTAIAAKRFVVDDD